MSPALACVKRLAMARRKCYAARQQGILWRAMSDIFREIDEEVRRDKAAAFWKKYGNVLIGLAVLAVLAVAGWQYWLQRENAASQAVGARLEAALKSSRDNNGDEAETILKELAANAPAGYRQIARFRLAAETAKRDPAAGATAFDALANDGSLAQIDRDVARLRAGMLRVDLVPYAELRTALEPLATPQGPLRHSAREFLGIGALKANLFEDAGRWFDAIVTDPASPRVMRQRVDLYLTLVRGGPVETRN
jgi:hypothetical protein